MFYISVYNSSDRSEDTFSPAFKSRNLSAQLLGLKTVKQLNLILRS
jgi:hypothetical protein